MATAVVKKKRVLTRDDHTLIQQRCQINPESNENYAAVLQKGKGFFKWSIHVFRHDPTMTQINKYEQTASRVEFKGQKARIEGSQIEAAVELYDKIIDRAYDIMRGLKTHEQLNREEAQKLVPPLVKREAIREMVGEVYSASRMEEIEGHETGMDDEDDDDPERHTSTESEG